MNFVNIIIFILFITLPVKADQKDLRLNYLFESLQKKNTHNEYKNLIGQIWNIWLDPNDPRISKDFKMGLYLMEKKNYNQAIYFFSKVIAKKPDFAEAWNKRATTYFIIGNFEKSIIDINYTLLLEPRHFGALDGLALIFLNLKQYQQALEIYKKILVLLPYSQKIRDKIYFIQNYKLENI